jgi:hypothetical protein
LLTNALPHEAGEIVPFLLMQSAERSDGVRAPEISSSANVVRPWAMKMRPLVGGI